MEVGLAGGGIRGGSKGHFPKTRAKRQNIWQKDCQKIWEKTDSLTKISSMESDPFRIIDFLFLWKEKRKNGD